MTDDLDPLEQHLVDALRALPVPSGASAAPIEAEAAWRAQIESRAIDHAARWLQSQKLGFYTIGSAGHESNALVALALRTTDPALLHYRSGGFYLARAAAGRPGRRVGRPARHGRRRRGADRRRSPQGLRPPRPRRSSRRRRRSPRTRRARSGSRSRSSARAELGVACEWPLDAVVVCSFGDASLNHATAQAALNTAAHFAYQRVPLPILFVCEDNGLGISVPTPEAWVEQSLHGRPELAIERVEGDDPATCSRPRRSSRPGSASTAIRPFSTSAPCAS